MQAASAEAPAAGGAGSASGPLGDARQEGGDEPGPPWTTERVTRERPTAGTATVTGARAGLNEGFDRFVLEFPGEALPTYEVELIEGPAVQCGSGFTAEVEGRGVLMIRLQGAHAHDAEGDVTVPDRRILPELPVLREARLICDFEAHVDWALGVSEVTAFRVLELTAPTRLVVDLRHPR